MTQSNLFGYSLTTDLVRSVISPKVGGPPPLESTLQRLYRLIGIQFEYKVELQNMLVYLLSYSDAISEYDVIGNTPELRGELVDQFIGCGPTMGFEAKKAAYGALELITEAMVNDDDISEEDSDILNSLLVSTTRFVGIAEGDHEDFHFMVATYNLLKELVRVVQDTVQYGPIVILQLIEPGTGIVARIIPPVEPETEPTIVDTAEDVVFIVSSNEESNPTNYEDAIVTAEIIDGAIDSLTLITNGGEGFFVGQVVNIDIDTANEGQVGSSQTTSATATVVSISS